MTIKIYKFWPLMVNLSRSVAVNTLHIALISIVPRRTFMKPGFFALLQIKIGYM